jgi:hypothetical protein
MAATSLSSQRRGMGGVDVEGADRPLAQVDGDTEDGAEPSGPAASGPPTASAGRPEVAGQDGSRPLRKASTHGPLADLLLEGLEHAARAHRRRRS